MTIYKHAYIQIYFLK